jgi:hypothetical protein
MGILGVVLGAIIVLGVIFFFAGGRDWIAHSGGGGASVTVNTPKAPSAPAAPAAPKAPATTGSR